MERTKKRVSKTVKVLTDPHPTFVSLVGRGANQTPFKVVKFDEANEAHTMKPTESKVTKTVSAQPEIHKIVFSGDKFETESSVQKYMTEAGYSNFAIDKVEKDFVIQAIAEEEFEAIEPIKKEDGVVMFVGKLNADALARKDDVIITINHTTVKNPGEKKTTSPVLETPSEPEHQETPNGVPKPKLPPGLDPVVTSKEAKPEIRTRTRSENFLVVKNDKLAARKIDTYSGYYGASDDLTIAEVLEDMEDGVPVGFYDVYSAFMCALKNVIMTDALDQIPTLMTEFGTIITKLSTLTGEVAEKADREAAVEKLSAVPSADVAKSKKQSEKPAVSGTPIIGELKEMEGFDVAIAKALEPMTALLEGLAKKEDLAPLQETVKKLAGRVLNVEAIRQTRKGGDVEDVTPSNGDKEKEKKSEEPKLTRSQKSLFGFAQ